MDAQYANKISSEMGAKDHRELLMKIKSRCMSGEFDLELEYHISYKEIGFLKSLGFEVHLLSRQTTYITWWI